MDEKEAYLQESHTKHDELNRRIDQLQLQAETAPSEKAFEIQGSVKDLRIKAKTVEKMVEDARAARDEAWKNIKREIDNVWGVLEAAVTKAESFCTRCYRTF